MDEYLNNRESLDPAFAQSSKAPVTFVPAVWPEAGPDPYEPLIRLLARQIVDDWYKEQKSLLENSVAQEK